jgi:hypothetical protein
MPPSSDYQKAYESAKQELADLLARQQEAERRIVVVRQSLQTLAELCESEGVNIQPSAQAAYLLESSTLADEIRTILKAASPQYMRPRHIKAALERLGHNLAPYQNPQATIHMVLKRMAESGEVEEAMIPRDGKKTYRISGPNPATSLPSEQGEEKDEKNIGSDRFDSLPIFVPRDHLGRRGRRGSRRRHGQRG